MTVCEQVWLASLHDVWMHVALVPQGVMAGG
jgi:hypothetical protein